jgi:predicted hydrolase (HD superfamily)
MATVFKSVEEAYVFLKNLGASEKLIRHVLLVDEAANILLAKLKDLGISSDTQFIKLGAALHDAGKILHPEELREKGNLHEIAGERLLLEHGVDPKLARCCRSHAQWQTLECSLEELIIALADNLWKGKRNDALETNFLERIYSLSTKDKWILFLELDGCFEMIANDGDYRLTDS